jgi:hypothetical protein
MMNEIIKKIIKNDYSQPVRLSEFVIQIMRVNYNIKNEPEK